jgi:pSer/pThr/pTyr-binding forkhead associated (FHA) protein
MSVSLVIRSGKHAGKTLKLLARKYVVGRGEDCDIRLASPSISRHHCCLYVTADAAEIEDLNSQNGTLRNNQPITGRTSLGDQDILLIGKTEFLVILKSASGRKPTTDVDIASWLQDETAIGMDDETEIIDRPETPEPPAAEPAPLDPAVARAADVIRNYHRNRNS